MIEGEYWWATSVDAKRWHGPHDTREEALAEGRGYSDEPAAVIYTGVGMHPRPDLTGHGGSLLERLYCDLSDRDMIFSGWGEGWLRCLPKPEKDRLDALVAEALAKWLDETCNWPTDWVMIEEIERHEPAS